MANLPIIFPVTLSLAMSLHDIFRRYAPAALLLAALLVVQSAYTEHQYSQVIHDTEGSCLDYLAYEHARIAITADEIVIRVDTVQAEAPRETASRYPVARHHLARIRAPPFSA